MYFLFWSKTRKNAFFFQLKTAAEAAARSGVKSAGSEIIFQSESKLVGAGCALGSALDTFETADRLVDLHSLHKRGNSLGVAVATSDKADVGNFAVRHVKVYRARAYSVCTVLHNILLK